MNIKDALKSAIDGNTAIDSNGNKITFGSDGFYHNSCYPVDFNKIPDEGWEVKKKPYRRESKVWYREERPHNIREYVWHKDAIYRFPFTLTLKPGHE